MIIVHSSVPIYSLGRIIPVYRGFYGGLLLFAVCSGYSTIIPYILGCRERFPTNNHSRQERIKLCPPGGGGEALGYFLGGCVPPRIPNWHPVLKEISPKTDTPF